MTGVRGWRRDILALLVVLWIAFGLRLLALADASIWWDEGWSVCLARQGLGEIARVTAADVHPPLYYWLLHLWRAFAGDSEFAVRFPSAALGTLTLVALWYLGQLLLPERPWVVVAGTLLLAASRFAIWWSQETRMYMLGGLLATLSLTGAVRLRWRPSWRVAVGYILVTWAALWTLYLLVFLLVIEGLYWLWTLREQSEWRARGRLVLRWAALQAAVLAGWAPWLLYALPRVRTGSVAAPFDPGLYLRLYATLLSLGISTNVAQYSLPVAAVMGLVLVGLITLLLRARATGEPISGAALLLLALAVPPAAVWLVTMLPRSLGYLPKPEARYLLPFVGSFYLLLAWSAAAVAGWAGRGRRAVATALLAGLLLLDGWSLRGYYAERLWVDDYESLTLTLRAHQQPDDAVVLHNDQGWPVFAYHWGAAYVGVPNRWDIDAPTAERFLASLWQEHAGLWLVVNEDALVRDPQRLLEQWLAERAAARHEWRFGSKRLLLFARTPARAAELLALAPGFMPAPPPRPLVAGGLALRGWEQPVRKARAGDVVYAAAYVWREGNGGTLSVGLDGFSSQQVEVPPGQGLVRIPLQVLLPADVGGRRLAWRVRLAESEAVEGSLQVLVRSLPASRAVEPQHALTVEFGQPALVRLLGYDLSGPAVVGGSLRLTLYWQALGVPTLSYKVFTHLEDDQRRVAAQRDDYPLQGRLPTTAWVPGQVIPDTYEIDLTAQVMPGSYTLTIGFYDPLTGERLGPVRGIDGALQAFDGVVLGSVEVVQR